MNNFADGGIIEFGKNAAHFWKIADRKSFIDQSIAKGKRALRAVATNEAYDTSQIFLRLRSKNYWVAHVSTSFRASSAGIPRP